MELIISRATETHSAVVIRNGSDLQRPRGWGTTQYPMEQCRSFIRTFSLAPWLQKSVVYFSLELP